jgi:hypothetical protein
MKRAMSNKRKMGRGKMMEKRNKQGKLSTKKPII